MPVEMLKDRYLLYIDILGFARMVADEPERAGALMNVIDHLNAHEHPNFKALVFSDTMLVYNSDDARNEDDHHFLVMYLIEFAMDLHSRLVGSGIFFRAVIRWGQFNHARLENIEAFYGRSLIQAYQDEKRIPCTGLFIDGITAKCNTYYPMVAYDSEYHYVLLAEELRYVLEPGMDIWPIVEGKRLLSDCDRDWAVERAIAYLSEIHRNMRRHMDLRVRAKFLSTWDLYTQWAPELCEHLSAHAFDPHSVALGVDWGSLRERRESELVSVGLARKSP